MSTPPIPSGLTDEAKAEIAAAIKIVREDRHDKMLREIHNRTVPPPDPPPDPNNPTPPPTASPPAEPTGPPKSGIWWGDRLNPPKVPEGNQS